jgi:hypothetical protein
LSSTTAKSWFRSSLVILKLYLLKISCISSRSNASGGKKYEQNSYILKKKGKVGQ